MAWRLKAWNVVALLGIGTAGMAFGATPATAPTNAVRGFDLRDVRLLGGPFKEAMDRNGAYLLSLEADRFLHCFRTEAGLSAKAPAYPGWESADQGAGRCLGHYLSALSLQYRATGDQRFKVRIDAIVDELAAVQAANGDGMLCAEANGKQFWARLAAGDSQALRSHRVPWYIQHKMFAGLRDAASLAGNEKAGAVLVGLCDWAIAVTAKLDDAGFQRMLEQEHGGMREVLCDAYAMTGRAQYLELARRFYHAKVVDPLADGRDELDGLHANTQIPKLIGEARWYELTGEATHRRAAAYFWDRVVHTRTYADGGNSERERFGVANAPALSNATSETCNTYNMLRLTRHLFEWEPRAEYADFVERALCNHILASAGPMPGNFTYYVPMKGGHYRTYSEPVGSFWCCVGTGMENHTKYGEGIYYHDDRAVYVNLFIPSEVTWDGMKLRQETDYPHAGTVRLIVAGRVAESLVLKLRYPGWAGPGLEVSVNGKPVEVTGGPGSYVTVERRWRDGDRVEMRVPLALRTEALAGRADRMAIFYGPVLLYGQLDAVDPTRELLKGNPTSDGNDDAEDPKLATRGRPVGEWIEAVPGTALTFRTRDVGLAKDLTLVPFYEHTGRRYVVYWPVTEK